MAARRALRWLLFGIGLLLLLVVLLVAGIFYSDTVFRQVVSLAKPAIPGELRYTSLDGSLSGPIRLQDAYYEISGTVVTADELSFEIAPFSLFDGHVDLDDVRARNLAVTLAQGDDTQDQQPARPQDIVDALRLPVEISADEIRIDGFRLRSAQQETLLELEHFAAGLHWNDKRLDVRQLDANGPQVEADGRITLALARGERSNVNVDASWRGGPFPVQGNITAQGTAAELDTHLQLVEPAIASLDVTLRDIFDTPQWQGSLAVEELQPSRLRDNLPVETWAGTFRFNGNTQDTSIQGSAQGSWPPAKGIALMLDADVNAERARVNELQASVDAFGAEMHARGEVRYADELQYLARGSISRFSWPGMDERALQDVEFDIAGNADVIQGTAHAVAIGDAEGQLAVDGALRFADMRFKGDIKADDFQLNAGGTQVSIAELQGHASGTPQDYDANLRARLALDKLPQATVQLQVKGTDEQLSARLNDLQWLDGNATGTAELEWRDALSLQATIQGSGFRLGELDPQLAATVGGNITAHADFSGEHPNVRVQIHSLNGEVAGEPLRGSGVVRLADGRIRTPGLDIHLGNTRLELEDSSGAGFDFALEAPALGELHPGASGSISARGHFEGSLENPTLRLNASGEDFSWQAWRAESFEIDADIRNGGEQALSVNVNGDELVTPWLETRNARLEVKGDLGAHRIALSSSGAGKDAAGNLQLAAAGGLENDEWRGELQQLQLDHPATGEWQLREGATPSLTLGANNIDVPQFCLHGEQGEACLGPFNQDEDGWQAQSTLDAIPVGAIAGLLPPGLDFEGTINGRFRVSGDASGLDGQAAFNLSSGGILQSTGEGSETLLGWESGRATVNFDGRVAQAELNIDLQDGGRIHGRGRLDVPESGAMTIDANVRANLDNLQLVPSLVPELSRLQGRITADLDVNGPLDAPRIVGRAQLHDGSARILALGTTWQDVNLELVGEGREISLTGRAESGAGHIDVTLEGRDSGDGFVGTARVTGENFEAIATPEAKAIISPQLKIELQDRDLYIDGDVHVPFARIEPRDFAGGVQPSEDQVIVNTEEAAAEEGLRLHATVTTRLGDDVRVDAFGLTARLEGKLTVSKAPDQRPIGNGRLVIVEGDYEAYGQDLSLAKGEIIYSGQPLTNPGLDIRAERTIEPDTVAGVTVRGPLSQPTVSVYSDPPMPDTAAMSYLLFGRSLEEVTGEEESQVTSASLAMNLGGKKLLGRVGDKLGVEEVRIDRASDPQHASLVFGKYLSPDLYVSYGVGLYEAVNSFQIRYRLSSKWTLEAASGLSSSADFLYTIER